MTVPTPISPSTTSDRLVSIRNELEMIERKLLCAGLLSSSRITFLEEIRLHRRRRQLKKVHQKLMKSL